MKGMRVSHYIAYEQRKEAEAKKEYERTRLLRSRQGSRRTVRERARVPEKASGRRSGVGESGLGTGEDT